MRVIRIFCEGPLEAGAQVILPAAGANHVARVLRMRPGAPLNLFDGAGHEFEAEILSIAGDRVCVGLVHPVARAAESPLRITLVQGISRGERMDWALQKATELGVAALAPVMTARSVVRVDEKQAQKKLAHWRGIVIGACEQCGRAQLPEISPPLTLREYLSEVHENGLRLVLSPSADASLASLPNLPQQVELLIGPEGGLDEAEVSAAQRAGFTPVRLGPRVLRTETAAVVALAVLQSRWGDLT